jgi:hypothetical protein
MVQSHDLGNVVEGLVLIQLERHAIERTLTVIDWNICKAALSILSGIGISIWKAVQDKRAVQCLGDTLRQAHFILSS